ncbi:prospero homeobox protein 1 [Lates japonicus]|uniref:Prospero homeobox protein 1 n=1 Tax=Lates japonicus TaxID=270547 RepID=A0AAD3MAN9_LATJO|nr:prospero homeobox protein 1 [Lates japonicus]
MARDADHDSDSLLLNRQTKRRRVDIGVKGTVGMAGLLHSSSHNSSPPITLPSASSSFSSAAQTSELPLTRIRHRLHGVLCSATT